MGMEAEDQPELEAVRRLTLRLQEAQAALVAGKVAGEQELALQQDLAQQLLLLRNSAGSRPPGAELAAAVLKLQETVVSFEHLLRVGMGQIRERLEPSSPTSASSFADRIGRGHSLGSA